MRSVMLGRLSLSLLLAEHFWHAATASTKSHHQGDSETEEINNANEEDRLVAEISAAGLAGAPSRRMMRAEKAEADSSETASEGAVPFENAIEVFNSTRTLPPQVIVKHSVQTTDAPTSDEQNCRWYDWSPWSYCSKSCGQGSKSRKRTVAVQSRNGGKQCEGPSEDLDRCNEFDCPVDCQWGTWNDWSGCTASCDGGSRQRGKPIKIQNNSLGKPCNAGEGIQVEDCHTQPCSRDCGWTDWSAWGACSTSCAGGVKLRSRSVAQVPVAGGRKCDGASQDEEVCNVKACPKDCVMSDWSRWSACSANCGNGTSARERKIISKEDGGGRACSDLLSEENDCFVKECAVNCQWADWTHWTACSVTCGANVSLWASSGRQRAVEARAGGKPCEGEDQRRTMCGQTPCPVECAWDDWSDWKDCTKSCGGGITERLRNVSIPAAHGGKDCMGSTRDVTKCNEELCPQDCSFANWEDWSECSKACGDGQAYRYRLIGTPAARGGQTCLGPRHETGPCNGTDCVSTADLIRKGYATQITGAMHIITEDPVSFSANPLVEQVSREALAEFAELPVTRVHVSMMPDVTRPRDVIDWFSMLVPNSTNLTAVLAHIAGKDLYDAGRILRNKLRRVGVMILVNVSKLSVNWEKKKPAPPNNTGPPPPAWNNPNATRLTGVVKMIVPHPLKFAEHLKAKEATEKLLAELSGIEVAGVRASLIPDQVYRYEAEFNGETPTGEIAKIPSDSVRNMTGEVHAWFSMVGAVQKDKAAATTEARKIAQAMMAEDLGDATVRNNFLLDSVGLPEADTKVIQILAKADGDQQQVDEPVLTLEEPPGQVRVTGVVEMVTDYPKSFAADRRAEEGMREALAQLAGVPADSVRVSLVPSESRADSLLQQPSEELGEIPPETPVDPDKGFKNEVSAWFAITLSTKSVDPTPEGLAEKLRDQDLTFAALKMQNCIMDEGLDLSVKVGRITAMLQTTTTTLAPGVIKKVDFGTSESGKGTSGGQTSGGDAGSDAARNAVLDSSIVSGDAATSPAKVVAVVASVSPDDVEPPTMSNPGGGDEESDDGEQTATKAPSTSPSTTAPSLLEAGVKSSATSCALSLASLLWMFHL
ncbi:unnamed protein product [Effrenium voratum]|nr:unnamed protein product [Effrenium voratum]